MRRSIILTTSTLALSLGAGAPSAWSAEQPNSGAGIDYFSIVAQSQAATGYLYAAGDEENRIAGALAKVDKPENVLTVAAAWQRGFVAGYTYGSTVGGGPESGSGGAGILPEPPPGEATALAPGDKTEGSWEGALTGGSPDGVIDGRAHAQATSAPSGLAEFVLQHLDVPGQLRIEDGTSISRGAPTASGVEAVSSSILHGITIAGVLNIESLLSRATAVFPVKGQAPATGTGSTVVSGATVNGVPVEITSDGLRLSDQAQGGPEKAELGQQVRQALVAAHVENIRLVEATTSRTEGGGLLIDAGSILVTYRDNAFAAANPQGFGGGGFGVGGASVTFDARRTAGATDKAAAATGKDAGATDKDVVAADRRSTSALAPRTS